MVNSVGCGVIAGAAVLIVVLIIGMSLFIASFAIVEPTYMAISQSTISKKVDMDHVYFEGRHFIGVGNKLILYPQAWQLIEYTDDESVGQVSFLCDSEGPLSSITDDGQLVSIEVSLYFSIPPEQLPDFFSKYGQMYQTQTRNDCKTVLKGTASDFTYQKLFSQRQQIADLMTVRLRRAMADRRCLVHRVLLRGIYFPDAVENNIEQTVIADQKSKANEYNAQISIIRAEITQMRKEMTVNITSITAAAERDATILVQKAKAEAEATVAQAQSKAWKNYTETLQLDSNQLLRIQWARSLGDTRDTDTIFVGFDKVASGFVQNVQTVTPVEDSSSASQPVQSTMSSPRSSPVSSPASSS